MGSYEIKAMQSALEKKLPVVVGFGEIKIRKGSGLNCDLCKAIPIDRA